MQTLYFLFAKTQIFLYFFLDFIRSYGMNLFLKIKYYIYMLSLLKIYFLFN